MDSTTLLESLRDIEMGPQLTPAEIARRCETAGRYLIFACRVVPDEAGGAKLEYDRLTNAFPTIDLPKAFEWLKHDLSADIRRAFVPGLAQEASQESPPTT